MAKRHSKYSNSRHSNNKSYSRFGRTAGIIRFLLITAITALLLLLLARPKPPRDLEEYVERQGKAPLVFSSRSGFYSEDVLLELDAPGILPEGAVICYTLDGTEPDINSEKYKEPILLKAGENPHEGERGRFKNTGDPNADTSSGNGAQEDAADADADDLDVSASSGIDAQASPGGADYNPDNPASETTVFTVRARICREKDSTDVQCGTYCVGGDLLPYENGFIVCVDTDPEGLYDYEKGILVGGKDLVDNDFSKYHGNYMKKGEEWIRSCHVAVFDEDGRMLQDRNAGLSISGGMSRRLDQKSFNLSAGEPYGDEDGHFYLDIFPDSEESEFAHVGSYTHLRLRARSQVPRTFRETLIGQLAEESNVRAAAEPRKGIVFLNGSFYMLAELEPTFSDSLLAHRFNLPDTDHIKRKKGKESSVFRKLDVTDIFSADMTQKENRDALEQTADMDDYLLEYAFNILTNNLDWPYNNVEAWRWTGEYDPQKPFTDGRLRFVIFDSDKAFNADPELEGSFGTDNLANIMENIHIGRDSAFPNIMKAKTYSDKFFTILSDLMNTSFQTDHVVGLIRESYAQVQEDVKSYYTEDYRRQIEEDFEGALNLASSRNETVRADLQTWFGLSPEDRYQLEVSAGDGVSVSWDFMSVPRKTTYTGSYYTDIPITLTASVAPGWRFDHWEVNGKNYLPKENTDEADGSVTEGTDTSAPGGKDNSMTGGTEKSIPGGTDKSIPGGTEKSIPGGTDGEEKDSSQDPTKVSLTVTGNIQPGDTCTVRAVAAREKGERLIISEVSAAGKSDWIQLYNAGTTDLDLGRYCLSDDPEDLRKFRLPAENLEPGETCRINGHRNESGMALCLCNFNLTADETLFLTPDEGSGLAGDSVRIPRMSRGNAYGRKDNGSTWLWFDRAREVVELWTEDGMQ